MSDNRIQNQRKRSVCLFGTSGDPPTGFGGHMGIVSYLANLLRHDVLDVDATHTLPTRTNQDPIDMNSTYRQGSVVFKELQDNSYESVASSNYLFDEVRVLPVYRHMFTEKRNKQTSFHHRLQMCRLAFQSMERVSVSDQERDCFEWYAQKSNITNESEKLSLRFGTIDLLEMLLEKEPDTDFTLALGADTFMDLTSWKWKRSKEVLNIVQGRLIVFQRIVSSSSPENVESISCMVMNNLPKNSLSTHEMKSIISDDDIIQRMQHVRNLFVNDGCTTQTSYHFLENESRRTWPMMLIRIPSLSNVSSSMIRSLHKIDPFSDLLSPDVWNYIQENKLYFFDDDP